MIETPKVVAIIVAAILINAFFIFPDMLWYVVVQTILFSAILFVLSPILAKYYDAFKIIVKQPLYIVPVTLLLVLLINIVKYLYINDNEIYETFKDQPIDTDTEPQHSYEHRTILNECGIQDDLNVLTEETKLDRIDVALQQTHTEIDKIIKYLNTNQPDERWLSKKQMDDPAEKLFF